MSAHTRPAELDELLTWIQRLHVASCQAPTARVALLAPVDLARLRELADAYYGPLGKTIADLAPLPLRGDQRLAAGQLELR